MDGKSTPKSRKEKRKESRLGKGQQKYESWISNQQSKKVIRKSRVLGFKPAKHSPDQVTSFSQGEDLNTIDISVSDYSIEKPVPVKRSNVKSDKSRNVDSANNSILTKSKGGLGSNPKSMFEEYLAMETKTNSVSAEDDLKLERRLAKKLKLKGGSKLRGDDDGMNSLFDGIPSVIDSVAEGEIPRADDLMMPKTSEDNIPVKKQKQKKRKKLDQAAEHEGDVEMEGGVDGDTCEPIHALDEASIKTSSRKRRRRRKSSNQGSKNAQMGEDGHDVANDVDAELEEVCVEDAPPVRAYVAPHLRSRLSNESEEHTQFRRRVRGLLNRLSEGNVESITAELSTIFRSVARSVSSQVISEEVLATCSRGPRGNDMYAAIFAALVAGMACSAGMDFGANLIAALSRTFEEEYQKKDNISVRNITLLLSYLCIFDVCSCDLIYDFLIILSKRLSEVDVSTILTILECCGMKLRGDDPAAMKNFLVSVQNRVDEIAKINQNRVNDVNEAKEVKASDGDGHNNKRMKFMLETICDIKNNKKRVKEDPTHHTRIRKWLQKNRLNTIQDIDISVNISLRGLTWSKLLDPEKKGQWWLSGELATTRETVEEVAGTIDKEVVEAQKMINLAAKQRMNTDVRKAIFCIVMSGEDYIDAFEKLLRLDLQGKQDREIMRVVVHCCLQEKVFNKYYTILASKLCSHDKNHKFTLQYCIWDHFKELETMTTIRSMHLARFLSGMLASFNLSLAVLKVVDFMDPSQLTPKRIMHFRMLFEAVFEFSDALVWNIFTRAAVTPELEPLRDGLKFFIKEYVVGSNKAVATKFKIAKKALNNLQGILM